MNANDGGGLRTAPTGELLDELLAGSPELPCTGRTGLFFSGLRDDIDAAKALCRGCPVRQQCLEYALKLPGLNGGVWGGYDDRSIRKLRRRLRLVP